MSRPRNTPPPPPGPGDPARAVTLLDTVKERHEKAFPGADGDHAAYLAHLAAVRQLTDGWYQRLLKPWRISYSEYRVLTSLRTRERRFRATPLDLNRVVQMTSAGMTRTLDRLEAAGLVERTPNPDDRRSVLVGLTSEGWSFAGRVARDLAARHAELLGDVPARTLAQETKTLRTIVERLAGAVGRPRITGR